MANVHTVSGGVTGALDKTLSFETGKLAGLADGAVVARLGNTTVLVTATAAKSVRDGIDFFPLTVDIEERSYAAGKIPGSFFRREGRAPDSAILTCRLIDRPLRPSFPDDFRNEVHVVGTVLGADMHNPYDVLAINGASAALMLSGIPFDGPIGAVRVAYTTAGEWIPHPTFDEGDDSTFELVVAGRALDNGDVAIMMVEAGGTEKSFQYYDDGAPKVDEAALAAGLQASKTWIMESITLQRQLVDAAGRKPTVEYTAQTDYTPEIFAAVEAASEGLQALLWELGVTKDEGLTRILSLARTFGCTGKQSGAGGGDGAVLFAPDSAAQRSLLDAFASRGIHAFAIQPDRGLQGEVTRHPVLSHWLDAL